MSVILENLAAKLGQKIVQYHSPYVWLYHGENPAVILKIEETKNDDKVFVNASCKRWQWPVTSEFYVDVAYRR